MMWLLTVSCVVGVGTNRRHEPILVPHIILTKSSTYVKVAVKFVTYTNDIAKLKFAKDYVENNNRMKHLK